mmetsp:Transcript_123760/g.385384  ORF Transcript_123760/g.385384 Transcript_123760/m.385384 type:complete len:577 (+) Transcript_123760:97-1827(+)
MTSRKIFVGSLPATITGEMLVEVFSKYGQVEETYVKPDCEPTRQWAFVTFSSPQEAQYAKECCDRQLTFPGGNNPCDIMFARPRPGKGEGKGDYKGGGGGYAPPPAYGCGGYSQPAYGQTASYSYEQPPPVNFATKIFVGSLPGNATDDMLRAEFSKYGKVEDIFVKPNCEPGRQFAFVNFTTHEEASYAANSSNGVLMFPGCVKPCEVKLAKNQGMFGQDPLNGGQSRVVLPPQGAPYVVQPPPAAATAGPRKIFVGSLPDGITDPALRAEFGKYGTVTDLFMKNNCESGRHWAFVTFASSEEAIYAKESCDRILQFPGADRPCEVTMARHQGMFGKDSDESSYGGQAGAVQYSAGGNYGSSGAGHFATPAPAIVDGPRKIFVGSIPDGVDDPVLRGEFAKYGQIVDLFIRQGKERNRHWAFVTFATAEQAAFAKESTDMVLHFHGADRPCEVMLAKNQAKFGQAPLTNFIGGGGGKGAFVQPPPQAMAAAGPAHDEAQPPPPAAPPPSHLTPWRMYKTASGIQYYHNASTGITQWECPPDLQIPGQPAGQPPPNTYDAPKDQGAADGQARYSPY